VPLNNCTITKDFLLLYKWNFN